LIDRLELAPENVPAFNRWCVDDYLAAYAEVPDIVRVRRYLTIERARHVPADQLVLHEFAAEQSPHDSRAITLRSADAWRRVGRHSSSGAMFKRVVSDSARSMS
jgi:hypothetical protein